MTENQKDKILDVIREDKRQYVRECEKQRMMEQGKIFGADYMMQSIINILDDCVKKSEGR